MSSHAINRRAFAVATLLVPAVLALRPGTAAAQGQSRNRSVQNAWNLISEAAPVSMFAEFVRRNSLEAELSAPGRWGFFIPINAAVERVPALQLERIRSDRAFARQVVLNHITDYAGSISIFGKVQESNWEIRNVKTRAGNTLQIVLGGGPSRIGGQAIVYTNIRAGNGMCNAIDGVLMP